MRLTRETKIKFIYIFSILSLSLSLAIAPYCSIENGTQRPPMCLVHDSSHFHLFIHSFDISTAANYLFISFSKLIFSLFLSLFRRMGCLGSKDRLTKEDMEFLKSHTRYDEVTIKEWYKGFKVSGRIRRSTRMPLIIV